MKRETILCIPTKTLFSSLEFTWFETQEKLQYITESLIDTNMWFWPRDYLETDPNYKQIIPYVAVRSWDKIGVYTRSTTGWENRLHNRLSIWFWWHISVADVLLDGEILNVQNTIVNSLRRELDEELWIKNLYPVEHLGYIYDPSNEVGKVHLGVVYIMEIDSSDIWNIEEHIKEFKFIGINEFSSLEGEFETWSQFLIEFFENWWK